MVDRIRIDNPSLAREVAGDVIVGKAFAFVHRRAFERPALAWARALAAPRDAVIPLASASPIGLPGARVDPVARSALRLRAIATDKALYREGKDPVHVLVVDAAAPQREIAIDVVLDGNTFAKRTVTLSGGGGSVVLDGLPAGSYELRFAGEATSSCELVVAEYRLAPLVAQLVSRRFEGGTFAARLRLEVYGVAFAGEVDVELTNAGSRAARKRVTAVSGEADVAFELSGAGPHALQIQLVRDASRTATVPIVGSRAAEREATVLSTLGIEVSASLLPAEGAREVRGIHLTEGALRTAPVRVERVDTRRVRLVFYPPMAGATVIVFDPTPPVRRAEAVDPSQAPHPALSDPAYVAAEASFARGHFDAALRGFIDARSRQRPVHPNYAYYVACCHARLGDLDAGIAALRLAIGDGWIDMAHLLGDGDLAALHAHPDWPSVVNGGARVVVLGDVAAGAAVEIDVPAPAALVAIGGFLASGPWEGWTATIAPSLASARVEVPATCKPGQTVRVDVVTESKDGVAWVIVKDARLLSTDTPKSRLAGKIKAWIDTNGKLLATGPATEDLRKAIEADDLARRPLPPPAPMMSMPFPTSAAPPMGGMPARSMAAAGAVADVLRAVRTAAVPAAGRGGGAPYREAAAPPPPALAHEPDTLFAGLVDVRGGVGTALVTTGDTFADYTVEAFVLAGLEWESAEARFRAESLPLAALDVPAFVHATDFGIGRAEIGTRSGEATVGVTRDGAPLALWSNDQALDPGKPVVGARASLVFAAGPGEYVLTVTDVQTGERATSTKIVSEPGKIRRLTKALRMLQPGERLRRADDPQIRSLRVLPSLDQPFRALVDATSDYGHACCEQTAAKMLAAAAMYVLASGPDGRERRSRAASILEAGVRREKTMWLRGRGFKMYPESSSEPNDYWGKTAVHHLMELAMLRPHRDLGAVVDDSLEMATDAARAYAIAWPPRDPKTCEQAYKVLLHDARPEAQRGALEVVNRRVGGSGLLGAAGSGGGAVALRVETSYAAASLMRAKDLGRALSLANAVVKQIGPEGRLYSTVDSVAAIALMNELVSAGVVGAGGGLGLEIDGRAVDPSALPVSAEEIRCTSGVVPVEILALVEERWDTYGAGVDVRISLERDGKPAKKLVTGDALDLRVSLPNGYKDGDILWVCLPDALSYLRGGGQVKRFSVDFAGRSEVVVPLAVTAPTPDGRGGFAPQHWAAAVRNMFEEERAGSPGLIEVTVKPS